MSPTTIRRRKASDPPTLHRYTLVADDGEGEIIEALGINILGGGTLQLWTQGKTSNGMRRSITVAPHAWRMLREHDVNLVRDDTE